eukprot:scaffold7207_cov520-Prasinococcus_capsulatus_cf.AAC.20
MRAGEARRTQDIASPFPDTSASDVPWATCAWAGGPPGLAPPAGEAAAARCFLQPATISIVHHHHQQQQQQHDDGR